MNSVAFKNLFKPVVKLNHNRYLSVIRKYAAIFVIALITSGLGYLLFTTNQEISYDPGQITLTLGSGDTVVVDDNTGQVISDANGDMLGIQKREQINFNIKKQKKGNFSYNFLKVPEGKRISLILSDSSVVYLNSNSSLRFPNQFLSSGKREVYLKGEAYFKVAKDASRPFVVNADDLDIEVLGTQFNVNAYEEYDEITATLAEGSIRLTAGNLSQTIVPGEAGTLLKNQKSLEVSNVIVANDIAWVEDRLLFIDEPFYNIMRKIERSYGVRIINHNPELDKTHFNGDFDLNTESVEDVLDAFTAVDFFEYSYKNKIVTIKK